jgi:CRP-like cAMP-binding protein
MRLFTKLNSKLWEGVMESLSKQLRQHSVFADLSPDNLEKIAGCASNEVFGRGEYIFKAGEKADKFYLVRFGKVSGEVYVPAEGPVIVDTVEEGNIFGWSWLMSPYKWHFDARALELTRVISINANCVRKKLEQDNKLGYNLMKHFGEIMVQHLEALRAQITDFYRNPASSKNELVV